MRTPFPEQHIPGNTITDSPIKADVHIHTMHSHATASVLDMYLAARQKNLTFIGFSEHSPRPEGFRYAQDYQHNISRTFPEYIREVLALKERAYQEGISVLLGTEFDYIAEREDFAAQFCTAYEYDYVIGGLHFQGGWGFDAGPEAWEKLSMEECFTAYARYYNDLARMCATGFFNVAAHPDLIKLHTKAYFDRWVEAPKAVSLIREALIAMRDNGVAMEISSAGLRKPCAEIYPGPVIMNLAQEVGVLISFGSDCHCVNTPAFAFAELARYAMRYGFRQSVIFKKRQPVLLDFESD